MTPWPGVEIRLLVALERVASTGSFSGAARELGYNQSAVSGQISALERIVGARLLERVRGGRSVRLTAEGGALYRHAVEIAAQLHEAHAELELLRAEGEEKGAGAGRAAAPTPRPRLPQPQSASA